MVPQTANVILFHMHSLIDLQASPRTCLSNLIRVMNVCFSYVRTFLKCVTHKYTHCLVARQGCMHFHACSHVQPLISSLALIRHLYYHQLPICLNPLKDHCYTCTVMAALLLSRIGPLLCMYVTDAIVTIMLHNKLTNKYETITIPFQLYSLAPNNSNILSQENN